MQTPAEKYLIQKVAQILENNTKDAFSRILNIGAGKSIILENNIASLTNNSFICDRMDIVDCFAKHSTIDKCFTTSIETMPSIKSNQYDIAFANYVFEHVANLNKAAAEIARVLKPSGYIIISLPNLSAPEFILSKYTPTKFHQFIKGGGKGAHAHETKYAYKNTKDFILIFEKYFSIIEIRYWSNTFGYLYRFPIINIFSKIYDKLVNYFNIKILMGNICIVFKK